MWKALLGLARNDNERRVLWRRLSASQSKDFKSRDPIKTCVTAKVQFKDSPVLVPAEALFKFADADRQTSTRHPGRQARNNIPVCVSSFSSAR